ncbi:MAG: 16S rRNA (guanine(527)-N(7))-methyltransferase RsmG [Bacteroidota bacterium]|nr:16S rRNA (guanine(527)-N(7))-methyltransferase RsmG [Bacteroidota bacterium]
MKSSVILKYFPDLSEQQVQQFQALEPLYEEWNSKINVISRKDLEGLYIKHVLHSLAIAKVVNFKPHTDILDVGTGGGFPGIPLAILFPQCNFHLIDSIGKKITVVQQIVDTIKLNNVIAEKIRAEQLQNKYDFIVSRAVTRLAPFYQWVRHKVKKEYFNKKKNGLLLLKGGDLKEELEELKLKYKIYPIPEFFEEDFFETKAVVYVPFH